MMAMEAARGDRAAVRRPGWFAIGVLAVVFVAAAAYATALTCGFAYDDVVHVVQNPRIRHLSNVGGFFLHATWPGDLYRPVVGATYALTYAIAELQPSAYHLSNLLLHVAATLVALAFLTPLLGRRWALLTSLLFAAHPVHVEAVASIAGRTEVLAGLFGLVTLWALLRAHRGEVQPDGSVRSAQPITRATWPAVALVSFALALLSKESAACLLLLVPLSLWLVAGGDAARTAPSAWRGWLRSCAVPMAVLAAGFAIYLALRCNALGGVFSPSAQPRSPIDNPLAGLPRHERLFHAAVLLGRYAGIVAVPWRLSPDYSYGAAGMPPDVGPFDVLFGGFWLAALVAAIALGWRRDRRIAFLALWFFAAFALTANVLGPFGPAFAERLAYLPSLGVCGLVAGAILAVESPPVQAALATAIVVTFGLCTAAYNKAWTDNESLWRYAMAVVPGSARVQAGVGELLSRRGRFDEARRHLETALRTFPDFPQVKIDLALLEAWEGHDEGAADRLRALLAEQPDNAAALLLLGRLHLRANRPDDAGKLFARVLNRDPEDVDAWRGVLSACLARGNLAQAIAVRDRLTAIDPDDAELRALSQEIERRVVVDPAGGAPAHAPAAVAASG